MLIRSADLAGLLVLGRLLLLEDRPAAIHLNPSLLPLLLGLRLGAAGVTLTLNLLGLLLEGWKARTLDL